MEWNDMRKGKWDVRSRLIAERNKLSLLTVGSTPVYHISVLNVNALVGAFNKEKALVGAFSVITNLRMDLFEALAPTRAQLCPAPAC